MHHITISDVHARSVILPKRTPQYVRTNSVLSITTHAYCRRDRCCNRRATTLLSQSDPTSARLVNDAEYQRQLQKLIEDASCAINFQDALNQATPHTYNNLSTLVHQYHHGFLLVGPNANMTQIIVLQAMVNFAGIEAQVKTIDFAEDNQSKLAVVDDGHNHDQL
jgi:hypothetical protein